jgi:uncharacterized protein
MILGIARIRLHLPNAHSLKDRRAVARRAVERIRARFDVSAAEVGDTERWQIVTLAVVLVTSDQGVGRDVLDRVTSAVASAVAGDAMITGREVRFEHYNDDEPFGDDAEGLVEKYKLWRPPSEKIIALNASRPECAKNCPPCFSEISTIRD